MIQCGIWKMNSHILTKPPTTRKSKNTNGIIDEIFLSEFFNDETNSVSKFVGIYQSIYSLVYTDRLADGQDTFFWKLQRHDDVDFFRRFYRRKYRGIQTRIAMQRCGTSTGGITDGYTDRTCLSVIPSVKASIYWLCRHSLSLFLLLLPLFLPHPTSPPPNCSQPPIPTLPSSE